MKKKLKICWAFYIGNRESKLHMMSFPKHSTFYKLNLLSKTMLKLMHKCKMTRQWIGLAGEWQLSGVIVYHHGSCMVYGRQPFKHRSSWDSKCRIPVVRRAWRNSKVRIAFSVWSEQTGKQKEVFECSRFILLLRQMPGPKATQGKKGLTSLTSHSPLLGAIRTGTQRGI